MVSTPAEQVVVRPGDKLLVRVAGALTRDLADRIKRGLEELLPEVEIVVIAAEQLLVYRPGEES